MGGKILSSNQNFPLLPLMAGSGLVGSCALSFYPSVAAAPVSGTGIAISSMILSYWLTQISEKKKFQEEKKDIGRLAIRRAQNLSDDLSEFSDFVSNHHPDPNTIKYWLLSKSRDATSSLDDIRDMSGMTSDANSNSRRVGIQEGHQPDDKISVNCVKCGTNNSVNLSHTPTSTRMFSCTNCAYRQNVHRLTDGNYKVSDPNKNQISNLAEISCPQCDGKIPIPNRLGGSNKIKRICFNCSYPIQYDRIEEKSIVLDIPNRVSYVKIIPESYSCSCGSNFSPMPVGDRQKRRFFGCYSCLRVTYESPDSES
jgi:hypothetical protein